MFHTKDGVSAIFNVVIVSASGSLVQASWNGSGYCHRLLESISHCQLCKLWKQPLVNVHGFLLWEIHVKALLDVLQSWSYMTPAELTLEALFNLQPSKALDKPGFQASVKQFVIHPWLTGLTPAWQSRVLGLDTGLFISQNHNSLFVHI